MMEAEMALWTCIKVTLCVILLVVLILVAVILVTLLVGVVRQTYRKIRRNGKWINVSRCPVCNELPKIYVDCSDQMVIGCIDEDESVHVQVGACEYERYHDARLSGCDVISTVIDVWNDACRRYQG